MAFRFPTQEEYISKKIDEMARRYIVVSPDDVSKFKREYETISRIQEEYKTFERQYKAAVLESLTKSGPLLPIKANPTKEEFLEFFKRFRKNKGDKVDVPMHVIDEVFTSVVEHGKERDKERMMGLFGLREGYGGGEWLDPPQRSVSSFEDQAASVVREMVKQAKEEILVEIRGIVPREVTSALASNEVHCLEKCKHVKALEARVSALTDLVREVYKTPEKEEV